mgnify:FL=1
MKKIDLTINGNKYSVEIGNIDGNQIEVNVNGTFYNVELSKDIEIPKTPTLVSTVVNKAVKETIPEQTTSVATRPINSPLPGVVLNVLVKEGDTVQRGQNLVIIEAMKMENEIKADGPGIVKRILVHKGDTISEGQTLVEIGGYSHKHIFIKFLKKLEIFALKKSDLIISNLINYQQYLVDNNINKQSYWISNGIDLDELQQIEPLDDKIKTQIPNNKFIIGYTGTIGAANAIDTFLEAHKYIDNDDIIFVIVGDGQEKPKLINYYKNDKIIFLDSIPKKQIQSLLQLFDVCYIGWRNINIYKYGISANKIFDYMYSGKPILHSYNGENDLIKIANDLCVILLTSLASRQLQGNCSL